MFLMLNTAPVSQTAMHKGELDKYLTSLVEQGINSFDIHQDIDPFYAGASGKFVADVNSRLAWWLDNQIIQNARTVLRAMPDETRSIDDYAEIENFLNEVWAGEDHGYDNGFDGDGALHTVSQLLFCRERWNGEAHRTAHALGKVYVSKSLEVQIGSPKRQTLNSNQLANARFNAMTAAGIVSNAGMRAKFDTAISQLNDAATAAREGETDEVERLQALLEGYVHQIKLACNLYSQALNAEQEQFDRFYELELKRIPQMISVLKFCEKKLLVAETLDTAFHLLPARIRRGACEQAMAALDRTLQSFTSKPSYIYSEMYMRTVACRQLLDRVAEDVGE